MNYKEIRGQFHSYNKNNIHYINYEKINRVSQLQNKSNYMTKLLLNFRLVSELTPRIASQSQRFAEILVQPTYE